MCLTPFAKKAIKSKAHKTTLPATLIGQPTKLTPLHRKSNIVAVTIKKLFPSVLLLSLLCVCVVLMFNGCFRKKGPRLRRHELFSISLGTLPNELDWFYRDGFRMAGTADIDSHNGFVFISGGENGKVMVFNSYGDLITYVYDPARNPRPVTIGETSEERNFTSWHFKNPRFIAAFDKGFLVDDGVEKERQLKASNSNIFYERVILRFDMDGQYLGHLGKEGFGGSPFPYIVSLDVREDGGIVVNSRVPGEWMSYWFDSDGHPIITARIQENQLPGFEESGNVAVYSMRPDPVEWALHIRIDVYPDPRHGDMPQPRLYTLNMNTSAYEDPIILNYIEDDPSAGVTAIPPEYLGTTHNGLHCMITSEGPSQYRMVFIDKEGRVTQNRRIKVNESTIVYRRFRLQRSGMLAGIFFNDQEALVARWRSDTLIENND